MSDAPRYLLPILWTVLNQLISLRRAFLDRLELGFGLVFNLLLGSIALGIGHLLCCLRALRGAFIETAHKSIPFSPRLPGCHHMELPW